MWKKKKTSGKYGAKFFQTTPYSRGNRVWIYPDFLVPKSNVTWKNIILHFRHIFTLVGWSSLSIIRYNLKKNFPRNESIVWENIISRHLRILSRSLRHSMYIVVCAYAPDLYAAYTVITWAVGNDEVSKITIFSSSAWICTIQRSRIPAWAKKQVTSMSASRLISGVDRPIYLGRIFVIILSNGWCLR